MLSYILIGLWLTFALVPIAISILDTYINCYVLRQKRKGLTSKLLKFIFRYEDVPDYEWSGDYFDGFFPWIISLIFGGFLLFALLLCIKEGHTQSVIIGLMIFGVLLLPRYIIDVLKSISYSFKERDSLRMRKLEEEIAKIKAKQ